MDELPANRLPIKNCVVGTSYRPKAYEFIAKEVAAGRQAYVICPMVEEGESEDLENVVDYTEKLRAVCHLPFKWLTSMEKCAQQTKTVSWKSLLIRRSMS